MYDILYNGVDEEDVTKPRNILVQGEAGTGKSTLCQLIAYLWAKNSTKVKRLHTFHLVVIIQANLVRVSDLSIYDYIARELLPQHNDFKEHVRDLKVLFLIDGIDELQQHNVAIGNLLKKSVCPHSTTIVTSRVGQACDLTPFNNGFQLLPLSPDDVSEFICKMSPHPHKTVQCIDFDIHPLGHILAVPLFLWFYVILDIRMGCKTFENASSTTRTSLFTSIMDGIVQLANNRLDISESHCETAVEELESIAYSFMCNGKISFEKDISHTSANIGLVHHSKRLEQLRKHTVYIFSHKSILEFLTARYISRRPNDACTLLKELPEIKDQARIQTSLVPYFLFGLIREHVTLERLFQEYISPLIVLTKISSEIDMLGHNYHFTLQCMSEVNDCSQFKDISKIALSNVKTNVILNGIRCNQYCVLGLKKLSSSGCNINKLELHYDQENSVSLLGDSDVVHSIIDVAHNNILHVTGDQNAALYQQLTQFYQQTTIDEVKLQR